MLSQADVQEHARKRCSQRRKLQHVSEPYLQHLTFLLAWVLERRRLQKIHANFADR